MIRPRFARRLALALLLLALASAGIGCMPPADSGPLEVGEEIPPFELPALGGGSLASQGLRGAQPVVVNFWATWCRPCVKEIPVLKAVHRSGAARVVSIALERQGSDRLAPFVAEQGIEYPVLEGDVAFSRRYGVVAIPYTLVLDGELRLVKVFKGLVSERTLERAIAEARAG